MVSHTVLVAVEPFGALSAARVAAAIERGLRAVDASLEVDCLPVENAAPSPGIDAGAGRRPNGRRRETNATQAASLAVVPPARAALDAAGLDGRMRAARAVVVGAGRLDERTLVGSATFEIATRARRSGVPAYAVTADNAMSAFDARMLDLQVILQAHDARALRRAGQRLAGIV